MSQSKESTVYCVYWLIQLKWLSFTKLNPVSLFKMFPKSDAHLEWRIVPPTQKWVCLKIVYPYTQWFCWSLPLLNGYHWGYTPFSDIPKWILFFQDAPPHSCGAAVGAAVALSQKVAAGNLVARWCPQTWCLLVYNLMKTIDISPTKTIVKLDVIGVMFTNLAIEPGHHLVKIRKISVLKCKMVLDM